MILLDAYGLVAFTLDEPAADDVEELLRERQCAMSSVNLAEAFDVLMRTRALAPERVRAVVEPLLVEDIAVVDVPAAVAWRAAEFRMRHYHRRARPLSLADCFLLAHADGDGVATADPAIADVAREEGIALVALPNSVGVRP